MTTYNIQDLLKRMVQEKASDLYLTVGYPPVLRIRSEVVHAGDTPLDIDYIHTMMAEVLTPDNIEEFDATHELNVSIEITDLARFRINAFQQQNKPGMVIRRIENVIPTVEQLGLPSVYADLAMEKRGLIIVVGQTGAGKSTALASMIGHRNRNGHGHIITIEDPIEFVHRHQQCIITQRDLGIDTFSFGTALRNALRQRPDVLLIGEIRDVDAMEHALNFAETGHLVLTTLHANNSSQAIERILAFFPEAQHNQVLLSLANNLKAVLSQRLVETVQETRVPAVEILLNKGLIRNLIHEGKTREIREMLEKNREQGMQTFDMCLLDLHIQGIISEEVALAESDNSSNLKLQIRQLQTAKKFSNIS